MAAVHVASGVEVADDCVQAGHGCGDLVPVVLAVLVSRAILWSPWGCVEGEQACRRVALMLSMGLQGHANECSCLKARTADSWRIPCDR